MDNVILNPRNRQSYITVRRNRVAWDVVLVTPGPSKIRTTLARAGDRDTALTEARNIAARMQLPVREPKS